MAVLHNPKQNLLLAALPAVEFRRLSTHLELVPMPQGESYYESGGKLQHVYFPTSAVVSLRYVMESGDFAELAAVGNEGMLGISVFLGDKALPKQAIVRTVGYGYRMKARLLLEEFCRDETLQLMLLSYTRILISQSSLTVICNRYHSIQQKLCRWLLLNLEQNSSSESAVTAELLASSLAVRLDNVIESLRDLREAGHISYHGGPVLVLNHQYLEQQSCGCCGLLQEKLARMRALGVATPVYETSRERTRERNSGTGILAFRGGT
jgi:hypothetical protein